MSYQNTYTSSRQSSPGPVPQVCLWSEGVAFHPQSAHPGGFSQADAPLCWALFYCQGSQSGRDQTQIVPSVAPCSPGSFTCPASNLFSALRPAPSFLLLLLTRRLLFTESVSSLTCALVGVVTSFWWTGRGMVPEERRWIPARDVLDRSLIEDFYRSRQAPVSGAPGGAR